MRDVPQRRKLKFQDLNEVLVDVEMLQSHGYTQAGSWDLAQICDHLADWMRFPVEGFPKIPLPMRVVLFFLRHTKGPGLLKRIIQEEEMPAGGPTMPATVYPPGSDPALAVGRFRDVLIQFRDHTGPLHASPVFGTMDHDTATRLQLLHCSHHLSFLLPKESVV